LIDGSAPNQGTTVRDEKEGAIIGNSGVINQLPAICTVTSPVVA